MYEIKKFFQIDEQNKNLSRNRNRKNKEESFEKEYGDPQTQQNRGVE